MSDTNNIEDTRDGPRSGGWVRQGRPDPGGNFRMKSTRDGRVTTPEWGRMTGLYPTLSLKTTRGIDNSVLSF